MRYPDRYTRAGFLFALKTLIARYSPKKVGREKRIPFDVSVDPFYSESNMRYLEQKMADYKAGKLKFAEHELIEE